MSFQSVSKDVSQIRVNYFCKGSFIPVGRLAMKDRRIFFEYFQSFLETGLELSPFKLPLKAGVSVCDDRIFDGLFGVFNDSLPDGWGRLLLDRKLMKLGIQPEALTPLDRLRYVGMKGMGALRYEPEIDGDFQPLHIENLDAIAEKCFQFQENDDDEYVDDLLLMSGSSAGARPKILVSLIPQDDFQVSDNNPAHEHNDWIIKFRSTSDPKDVGSIEYAYHLMAKDAGLDVPKAKLFRSKKSSGYFGVKRFDRQGTQFIHMHTVSGLLHADHRYPTLNYETLMKVTLWLTKDQREAEKQLRNAAFNIFAHNRDDHAKNFSFLMDENGVWRLSPAYDLTFSQGSQGEHSTMIMGEGRNPGTSHLLKLAEIAGIEQRKAKEIIDQVKQAVSKWSHFAKEAKVSENSRKLIEKALVSS